jgi:hypothetical protein
MTQHELCAFNIPAYRISACKAVGIKSLNAVWEIVFSRYECFYSRLPITTFRYPKVKFSYAVSRLAIRPFCGWPWRLISLSLTQGLLSIWSGLLRGCLLEYSHWLRLSIFGKFANFPYFCLQLVSPGTILVWEASSAPSSLNFVQTALRRYPGPS